MWLRTEERKWLLKVYNHLYKRSTIHELDRCAYCGYPRECYDHVPPLSLLKNADIEAEIESGTKFILYPSCQQCNLTLSNINYLNYKERAEYLIDRYNKKLNKIETWTQKDIDDLGYTLKTGVQLNRDKLDMYNSKIYNLDLNIIEYSLKQDELY